MCVLFWKGRYNVTTLGLLPQDDYTVDIAKEVPVLCERYDVVLHAAGKAHSVLEMRPKNRYSLM